MVQLMCYPLMGTEIWAMHLVTGNFQMLPLLTTEN